MIPGENKLTRTSLRTPKAAAFAGIIFSVLLVVIISLLRLFAPADPLEPGAWLATNSRAVALAINLIPFDGVALSVCSATGLATGRIAFSLQCSSAAGCYSSPCCLRPRP